MCACLINWNCNTYFQSSSLSWVSVYTTFNLMSRVNPNTQDYLIYCTIQAAIFQVFYTELYLSLKRTSRLLLLVGLSDYQSNKSVTTHGETYHPYLGKDILPATAFLWKTFSINTFLFLSKNLKSKDFFYSSYRFIINPLNFLEIYLRVIFYSLLISYT